MQIPASIALRNTKVNDNRALPVLLIAKPTQTRHGYLDERYRARVTVTLNLKEALKEEAI